MKKSDVISKLKSICKKGFVPTIRKGDTGIGHTFESLFGVRENNIPIPDIGGRVEIKTGRKSSTSMITLFTFNRAVWVKSQAETINKYGIHSEGRVNLYNTLFYGQVSNNGLSIDFDEKKNLLRLVGKDKEIIAEWDLYVIVGKFNSKLSRVLYITAEAKEIEGREHFHYNEAHILIEGEVRKFITALRESKLAIDLRMHLSEGKGVRNHGTGFRCSLSTLKDFYSRVEKIDI